MYFNTEQCRHCDDTGINFITFLDDGIEMLVRCHCTEGKRDNASLPQWSQEISNRAVRMEFPRAWFKPTDGKPSEIAISMGHKVEEWKAKKKIAEEFWEHQQGEAK